MILASFISYPFVSFGDDMTSYKESLDKKLEGDDYEGVEKMLLDTIDKEKRIIMEMNEKIAHNLYAIGLLKGLQFDRGEELKYYKMALEYAKIPKIIEKIKEIEKRKMKENNK